MKIKTDEPERPYEAGKRFGRYLRLETKLSYDRHLNLMLHKILCPKLEARNPKDSPYYFRAMQRPRTRLSCMGWPSIFSEKYGVHFHHRHRQKVSSVGINQDKIESNNVNPFTLKSEQVQIPPEASPEILHHTV